MEKQRKIYGSTNIYGYTVGILMIEGFFPRPPGAVGNALSFPFPVLHYVVPGAVGGKIVHKLTQYKRGDREYDDIVTPWIEGAKYLEQNGVRAITTSCGFTALFQKELSSSVHIPVFTSSLMLLPMMYGMLRQDKKVGVLTADAEKLTAAHFTSIGADIGRVVIRGLENCRLFNEMVFQDAHEVEYQGLSEEIVEVARTFRDDDSVEALLLECSQLPPFAHEIQQNVNLPVFDYTSMITLIHEAFNRKYFI